MITAQEPSSGREPVTSLAGLRVLLVEDSWIVAQSYAALLDNLHASIAGPVTTVAEALALIASRPLDVALVDMSLNGEMAYAVIDALNARGVPIVVVTGADVAPDLEPRVRVMLRKPIRVETLIKHLRSVAAGG